MKKIIKPLVLLAVLLLTACNLTQPTQRSTDKRITVDPSGQFVEGQLLVGYQDSIDGIANRMGATVSQDWSVLKLALLELPKDLSVSKAQSLLKGISGVRYTQPNNVYKVEPLGEAGANLESPSLQTTAVDDPEYGRQWQHRQLRSEEAWDLGISGQGIRIGIHDDFLDHRHPDLAPNVITGWDGFSDSEITASTPHDGIGTHGSGTAGKAAAAANSIGGRGVAYGANIVPLNISEPENGALITSAIVSAGIFAALGPDGESQLFGGADSDNAPGSLGYVHIVNMSWGGNGYDQATKDTMDLMLLHDIVLVASAGNENTPGFTSPAWLPGVITVAATDPHDRRTEFSNRGKHIDVAAPGQNTWSTTTRACILLGRACTAADVDYAYFGGTSSASPATAGVAALVMEALATKDGAGNITAIPSPAQVRQIIMDTARQPNGDEFNEELGAGIVDAGAAVRKALELKGNTVPDGGSLIINIVATDDPTVRIPNVGLTLIPLDNQGAIEYTQSSEGILFGDQGQARFLEVNSGAYNLLASGPHSASTGFAAATSNTLINLAPGEDKTITINLDVGVFEDPNEPNNTAATATPITVGTTTRASIYNPGSEDRDYYSFAAVAGDDYWINLETLAGSADATITVYASNGTTVLASNDDYRTDGDENPLPDPALIFSSAASQTVYVAVIASGSTNSAFDIYDLDISEFIGSETEPNGSGISSAGEISDPDFTGANPLLVGQAIAGTIEPETDVDFFAITLGAGAYSFDIETPINLNPDTVLVLFDSTGEPIASNDDADLQDSRLELEIETPGDYYLAVISFLTTTQASEGEYILSAVVIP